MRSPRRQLCARCSSPPLGDTSVPISSLGYCFISKASSTKAEPIYSPESKVKALSGLQEREGEEPHRVFSQDPYRKAENRFLPPGPSRLQAGGALPYVPLQQLSQMSPSWQDFKMPGPGIRCSASAPARLAKARRQLPSASWETVNLADLRAEDHLCPAGNRNNVTGLERRRGSH